MSVGHGSIPGSPMAGHGGPFGNVPELSNNAGDIAGPSTCMDATPCGVAHLCFEPEGTAQQENWRFVGDGRGEFHQMHNQGVPSTFSKESRAHWGKTTKQICQGFMLVLGLAGVVYLVYTIMTAPKDSDLDSALTGDMAGTNSSRSSGRGTGTAARTATPSPSPEVGLPSPAPPTMRMDIITSTPFDCEMSFFNWRKAWSAGKKNYCCKQFKRGCVTSAAPPESSHERPKVDFDCTAGFSNFQIGWSLAKQQWCCEHFQKACNHAPNRSSSSHSTKSGVATEFDCSTDGRNSRLTPERQVFCCIKFNMSCPNAARVVTPKPQQQLQRQQHQQQQPPAATSARPPQGGAPQQQQQQQQQKQQQQEQKHAQHVAPAAAPVQQQQQQQKQQQQEQKHAQHVAPAAAPVPQLSAKILPQAPQASVPVVQQQPKVRTGCNALCKMNGVSKSCRFLVHFAATRSFARKPDACQMAYTVVRSRCGDSCSGCMLEATHCT
eukprot:CAMPEP_0172780778 /NCGR_PEP_ID=MMETSP1074-20121228/203095_1 /TAXON_ID=2916 /ORGANISM="Ceratium fusus, Strain PA161109" /LENGTH=491 /DNA_ID=CAMNT_0013617755 /DNA_START=23 /DNA_END=1498 /DNA_ORIENTATION=+